MIQFVQIQGSNINVGEVYLFGNYFAIMCIKIGCVQHQTEASYILKMPSEKKKSRTDNSEQKKLIPKVEKQNRL